MLSWIVFCWALWVAPLLGCSNLLVPAGSSDDGSTILGYNDDQPMQVGGLSHWPAGQHGPNDLRPVHDWDSEAYLGAIPQPAQTYNVIGNTNEHQVTITETTFGGLSALDGSFGKAVCNESYGCLDYASLIWISLGRARTARDAIVVVDHLMQTYGYSSSGESFSIADPSEVWLMELIGKGNFSKGAVWVATKIPDGYVCAHANQARTTEMLLGDPERFRCSHDVVDFARTLGLYHGQDHTFSFSDVYDPVTPYSVRTCEARVYSFFRHVAAPEVRIDKYLDYVRGFNLANRMPLYVKVGHKISVNETFWLFRDHFEGTILHANEDVGAGNWKSPTRLGSEGKVWEFGGERYVNQRPIGVPFTQWNMVATQRPNHRFGVMWFGVDDSTFTLRAPFYGVASRVPSAWDDGNCTGFDSCREKMGLPGTMRKFSFESMYWVTNMVANFAYSRYDAIAPAVFGRLAEIEARLLAEVSRQDMELAGIEDEAEAVDAASDFSYRTAESLHKEWQEFYGELFTTFMDGYDTVPDDTTKFGFKKLPGGDLRLLMKAEIATQTGSKYRLPGPRSVSEVNLASVIDKRRLRSFGKMGEEEAPDPVPQAFGVDLSHVSSLCSSAALLVCGFLFGIFFWPMSQKVLCNNRRSRSEALEEPLTVNSA